MGHREGCAPVLVAASAQAEVVRHGHDVEGQPGLVLAPVFVLFELDSLFHLVDGLTGAGCLEHRRVEVVQIGAVITGVGLGAKVPVPGNQDVEVQGFDRFDGLYPAGELGVV